MKKVITFVLMIAMIASMIPALTLGITADTEPIAPDTSWYTDTAYVANGNKYLLNDAADVLGFSNLLAGIGVDAPVNFEGKNVELTADVDLKNNTWGLLVGAIDDDASRPESKDPLAFAVLQNYGFWGNFDGKGHSIRGIYFDGYESDARDAHDCCLFGIVPQGKTASVKNLAIRASYIEVSYYSGAIFSTIEGTAVVDSVYLAADTTVNGGGQTIGAFVGRVMPSGVLTISNCVMEGEHEDSWQKDRLRGGFVGASYGNLTIENCAMYGALTKTTGGNRIDSKHAGIIRTVGKSDSYQEPGYAPSLTIKNVIVCANIADSYDANGNTLNKVIYLMPEAGAGVTVAIDNVFYVETSQPLMGVEGTKIEETAITGNTAQSFLTEHNLSAWSTYFKGKVVPTTMLELGFYSALEADHWYHVEISDATPTVLVIDSVEDMKSFLEALVVGYNFSGFTVEMTVDIDLNPGWNAASAELGDTGTVWNVNSDTNFEGVFDGKGHTLSGVYQSIAANGIGIFGKVTASATVKDMTITNSYLEVTGTEQGTLFGSVNGTVNIENVYIDAIVYNLNVSGYGVGGFVGKVLAKGALTIKNSVFAGEVISGNTTALQGVGGFIGLVEGKTTLENCGSFGKVICKRNMVSGLIGMINNAQAQVNVFNCIVGGTVESGKENYIGSYCGHLRAGTLEITNSYYIKLNNASYLFDCAVFGMSSAEKDFEGAILVSDMDVRGVDTAAFLTEKGLSAWTATEGYPVPTALKDIIPTDVPGTGTEANDVAPNPEKQPENNEPTDTETDTDTQAVQPQPSDKKSGCKSGVLSGFALIAMISGAALTILKKEHN